MIKKLMSKTLKFSILASLLMNTASAMPLSLNESIGLALKNDESIESAEYSREAAKWNLSATRRQGGPTFSWSSQALRIGGNDYEALKEQHNLYGRGAYNNTFSNSLSLSIPLYTGGQLENTIKTRRYAINSADLTLENTRQTVKYQVIEAYYNVLQNQNIVEVNKSAVNMSSEQLNLLQIQYEEGAIAYSDVLQMQVQMANYNQNLISAESTLDVSKSTLLSLIELPEDTEIELTDRFLYTPYTMTLEECMNYAAANRPDLAAALYNVNQAEASVAAAKAGNRPRVTGVASKSISSNNAFQNDRSDNWQAGLSLSWSIFDNQVTSANVHAAKSEVERLKANVDALNKNVALQVRSAYTRMKAAEENVKLNEIAVKQAEESYELAVVRHVEGVDILLNVTNAQDKLTQAQTNYYSALYQYNLYRAQLEKAMGIPVGFNVPLYIEVAQEGKSATKALEAAEIQQEIGE